MVGQLREFDERFMAENPQLEHAFRPHIPGEFFPLEVKDCTRVILFRCAGRVDRIPLPSNIIRYNDPYQGVFGQYPLNYVMDDVVFGHASVGFDFFHNTDLNQQDSANFRRRLEQGVSYSAWVHDRQDATATYAASTSS